MDRELLKNMRECGQDDRTIEIIEEGIETLRYELKPIIQKLKLVDKQFAIDMLEEYILLLNDLTALCMKHITDHSKKSISPDQALLFAALNQTINSNEHVISSCESNNRILEI